MPDGLEYIVRPYQSPSSHGVTVIPSTPGSTFQRATLTWGAKSTMPAAKTTGTGFKVVCCQTQLTEQDRQSDNIDIPIQTDDGTSGHVTVARARTLHLNKKNKDSCGSSQLSYASQEVSSILDEWADVISALDSEFTPFGQQKAGCTETWELSNKA